MFVITSVFAVVLGGMEFDVQVYGLPVCFGPGDESPCTGQYVWPGEALTISMTFWFDGALPGSARAGDPSRYVKLADGRGWIRSVDNNGHIHVHSLL